MPPMMRIAQYLTLFFVLLSLPVTALGSYFAYTQSRTRVEELNAITPLHKTDLGKVVELILGLDQPQTVTDETTAINTATPAFAIEVTRVPTLGAPEQENDETPTAEAPSVDVAAAEVAPASIDPRRVTVLLMGIDQREGEEGQFRTDTMMVLSLDPVGKTGAMLSIPRDLWVSIPGTSTQSRINTANFIGDNPDLNYPGGGPALAMLTVEKLLGVRIDHYVLVNFDAFTTFVNTVGSIEICVQERIDDPKYPDGSYGFNPIVIEAGCQQMDAERLLQYARTRATPGGDFDRANRQQEVILAVRDKILSAGGVTALLGDSLNIWESLSTNIRTDLTLDRAVELALVATEINDIRKGTISTGEVLEGMGDDGSQVLIPIQTDIFALVADLMRPPNRPAASADQAPQIDPNNLPLIIRQEAPILELLNGTDITGRARSLQSFLQSYSLDVGFLGNASTTDINDTYIVYYGDHANSAEYVADVLSLINGNNRPLVQLGESRGSVQGDVVVVVGRDLAIPQAAE